MKKTLLCPLVLGGLLLAGCARNSSTKTAISAASNKSTDSLPSAEAVAAAPTPVAPGIASTDPVTSVSTATPPPTVSVSIPPPSPPAESDSAPATPEKVSPVAVATPDLQASTGALNLASRIIEWDLTPHRISEELSQSDHIERSKMIEAGAPTGAMETGVVTDLIAGKLQADADVSAQKFGVMVLGDVATLTGSAHTAAQIGRAMALALDTDGVSRVISKITLEPSAARR